MNIQVISIGIKYEVGPRLLRPQWNDAAVRRDAAFITFAVKAQFRNFILQKLFRVPSTRLTFPWDSSSTGRFCSKWIQLTFHLILCQDRRNYFECMRMAQRKSIKISFWALRNSSEELHLYQGVGAMAWRCDRPTMWFVFVIRYQ